MAPTMSPKSAYEAPKDVIDLIDAEYDLGDRTHNVGGYALSSASTVATRVKRLMKEGYRPGMSIAGHAEDMKYLRDHQYGGDLIQRVHEWTDQFCERYTYTMEDGVKYKDWRMKAINYGEIAKPGSSLLMQIINSMYVVQRNLNTITQTKDIDEIRKVHRACDEAIQNRRIAIAVGEATKAMKRKHNEMKTEGPQNLSKRPKVVSDTATPGDDSYVIEKWRGAVSTEKQQQTPKGQVTSQGNSRVCATEDSSEFPHPTGLQQSNIAELVINNQTLGLNPAAYPATSIKALQGFRH